METTSKEKTKTAYRVSMAESPKKSSYPNTEKGNESGHTAEIIDNFLGAFGQIINYTTRVEADKKASRFQGIVVPIKLKAVKTTFKVWTTIEECVEYEDGSEKFTDIKEEMPFSAGTFTELKDAIERTEEIGNQYSQTGSADNVPVG